MGMAPAHNLFGVVDEHMSDGRELKHNHDEAERHPTSGQRDTVESHLRVGTTTAERWPRKRESGRECKLRDSRPNNMRTTQKKRKENQKTTWCKKEKNEKEEEENKKRHDINRERKHSDVIHAEIPPKQKKGEGEGEGNDRQGEKEEQENNASFLSQQK